MTDDRSERLRRRRKRSTADGTGTGAASSRSDPSGSAEQSDRSGTDSGGGNSRDGDGGTASIKEEQTGTYMYLPESQTRELRRLYNVLKAEYEFEYDEEFEKNRHFYPLVVRYGLESLDSIDAPEIRERLDRMA